jgi:nitrate reductase (NAD(P)H)
MDWMRLTTSAGDLSGLNGAGPRKVTMAEVREHNTEYDCWSVLNGNVYNITPYLPYHPGTKEELMRASGDDMTALFKEYHTWVNGDSMLEACLVGELDTDAKEDIPGSDLMALQPDEWRAFPLLSKEQVSSDSWRYRFAIPKGKRLGLETPCQHLQARAMLHGKEIIREYTPITTAAESATTGTFDLVIKVYDQDSAASGFSATGNSKSKKNEFGKMGQYINSLGPGVDALEMRGPRASVTLHTSNSLFEAEGGATSEGADAVGVGSNVLQFGGAQHVLGRTLGLVAAGSGITPMYQLIATLLGEEGNDTAVTLLYCCHSADEIMLRQELDGLVADHASTFSLRYMVSVGEVEGESMQQGRLDDALLKGYMPAACAPSAKGAVETCILYCGPPSFNDAVRIGLRRAGHRSEQMHHF